MAEIMNAYYMSDNNNACRPIQMVDKIESTQYPFIVEAPGDNIKSPKYDWKTYQWVENDIQSKGERLTKIEAKVAKVDNVIADNAKTQSVLKQMQQSSMQSTQMMG